MFDANTPIDELIEAIDGTREAKAQGYEAWSDAYDATGPAGAEIRRRSELAEKYTRLTAALVELGRKMRDKHEAQSVAELLIHEAFTQYSTADGIVEAIIKATEAK